MTRTDGLKPDAINFHHEDGHTVFEVELGEGTAYLSLISQNASVGGDPQPEVIVTFEPRSDVEEVRRLANMLLAWADTWQDEYNRFLWAPPCGINLSPAAQPNPECVGVHGCTCDEEF